MGNSALKAHLETSQKTGVFQLRGKNLQEVNKQTNNTVLRLLHTALKIIDITLNPTS